LPRSPVRSDFGVAATLRWRGSGAGMVAARSVFLAAESGGASGFAAGLGAGFGVGFGAGLSPALGGCTGSGSGPGDSIGGNALGGTDCSRVVSNVLVLGGRAASAMDV
jgi:hypothetical protein